MSPMCKNLEHVDLLASQNTPAVMRIGERYPIVNATFAPIYNSSRDLPSVGQPVVHRSLPVF